MCTKLVTISTDTSSSLPKLAKKNFYKGIFFTKENFWSEQNGSFLFSDRFLHYMLWFSMCTTNRNFSFPGKRRLFIKKNLSRKTSVTKFAGEIRQKASCQKLLLKIFPEQGTCQGKRGHNHLLVCKRWCCSHQRKDVNTLSIITHQWKTVYHLQLNKKKLKKKKIRKTYSYA